MKLIMYLEKTKLQNAPDKQEGMFKIPKVIQ